jgi:hypothetical protein
MKQGSPTIKTFVLCNCCDNHLIGVELSTDNRAQYHVHPLGEDVITLRPP